MLNLGELKTIVKEWADDDFIFENSFANPHSYRAYYNELAFSKSNERVTVGQIKQWLVDASVETFHGWKGGEYTYNDSTPIHLSSVGKIDDIDGIEFSDMVENMCIEYATKEMKSQLNSKNKPPPFESSFIENYADRLLRLFHTAMTIDPDVVKIGSNYGEPTFEFYIGDPVAMFYFFLKLPDSGCDFVDEDRCMTIVEEFFERKVAAKSLEAEKQQRIRNALSKLTDDERESLGL